VGYAERNSAREVAIHKLQIPAVTRPGTHISSRLRERDREPSEYIPQTILVLPPEGKLRDKLADKAVHDYSMSIVDSDEIWVYRSHHVHLEWQKPDPASNFKNE
jgi:hypothetical protein